MSHDGTYKIDKNGRVVIPKSIRDKLGITQKTQLIISISNDSVLIRRISFDTPPLEIIYVY